MPYQFYIEEPTDKSSLSIELSNEEDEALSVGKLRNALTLHSLLKFLRRNVGVIILIAVYCLIFILLSTLGNWNLSAEGWITITLVGAMVVTLVSI